MSSPDKFDAAPRTVEQLAELFTRHREHLRRMVRVRLDERLARRLDVSDVLQEAYVNAQQRLEHAARMDSPPLVWLRQIAEQTLVDLYRRHMEAECRAVGREVPLPQPAAGMTSMVALAEVLAGGHSTPSQAAMRNERRAQLEAALAQMDPIDREVLVLRHFEELTNQEIAALLGLQPTAASNRYFRALKRLKSIVESLSSL